MSRLHAEWNTGPMAEQAAGTKTGLPRALSIAWGMDEAPQRGPARGLSHGRIVAAAIEIADGHGLAAVTMQAIATSLGFTTMSLYRYVANKDELLKLMQDTAIAVPDALDYTGDWRGRLRMWAEMIRDAYRAHPWSLGIPRSQNSVLMPNALAAADLGMQAMEDVDIPDDSKIAVILIVSQLAASMVELELSLADEGDLHPTEQDRALLAGVITDERFPYISRLYRLGDYVVDSSLENEAPSAEPGYVEDEFAFGLDLIITGIEDRQGKR